MTTSDSVADPPTTPGRRRAAPAPGGPGCPRRPVTCTRRGVVRSTRRLDGWTTRQRPIPCSSDRRRPSEENADHAVGSNPWPTIPPRGAAGRLLLPAADVRGPGQGVAGSGPPELGRRPPVRPARRHRRGARGQRRPRRAAVVRRPRPHRLVPRRRRRSAAASRRPNRRSSRAASGPTARSTPTATCSPRWPPRSGRPVDDEPDAAGDPMMAMMAGLSKMMAPAMLGMAVGSMVGHLATRAFGTHDLPIPRQPNTVTLLPSNIDAFATDWEIPGRRDAAVGARPRAGRPRPVRGRPRPRRPHRPRPPARRRLPPRSQRRRRAARLARRRGAAIRWRPCSRRSAIPRCCSAR